MKRVTKYTAIATFLFIAFATYAHMSMTKALAQQASIAIVDKAAVASQSNAWKTFQKKLEVDVKNWQKKARSYEEELTKGNRELIEGKNNFSPADFQQKQQQLKQKQVQYNQEMGKEKLALDQKVQKAEQTLNKEIDDATAKIGKERNISIVLNAVMVIHKSEEMDITKEVVKRVNKKLKKL